MVDQEYSSSAAKMWYSVNNNQVYSGLTKFSFSVLNPWYHFDWTVFTSLSYVHTERDNAGATSFMLGQCTDTIRGPAVGFECRAQWSGGSVFCVGASLVDGS